MAKLFHVNKYKYNDEIRIEKRHYEWYNTGESIDRNGNLCYSKERRTYTEIVGVRIKTNRVITDKHHTFTDLLDELEELGYKMLYKYDERRKN